MASAFSDSLIMASWGGPTSPKISGTTKGMTMKCLTDVSINEEARKSKKNSDITDRSVITD